MTQIIKRFTLGEQKYRLEFGKGYLDECTCFSIHITKYLEEKPIVIFYRSRFKSAKYYYLQMGDKITRDIDSVKEGKRLILDFLLNEN